MVDKDIIQRKISFIEQRLSKLDTLRAMKRLDFLESFQAIDAAKYNFQVCIEAIIDIAQHVIARERWGVPDSSAEAIKYLIQNGVLNKTQELPLVQMVKFRNRIVHLYQEVDDSQIYRILQENLNDIRGFIKCIISKYF